MSVLGHGHDDNDENDSLADDDDGDMILLRCLMVQKAVQNEYIAKCLSFIISTEEGDYYEATNIDTEKDKKKRKRKSGKSKVFKVSTRGSRRFSKETNNYL